MSSSEEFLRSFDWMFDITLGDEDIVRIAELIKNFSKPLRIYFFIKSYECPTCRPAINLASGLRSAISFARKSELIRVSTHSLEEEPLIAKFFSVKRVPSVVLLNGYIKYYGVPSLEELPAFIETLIRVGTESPGVSESVSKELTETADNKTKVEVLITPTCPYCPYVVLLANMFAYISYKNKGRLTAEIVELYENQDVAYKYGVMSVPAIAINDKLVHIGSVNEWRLMELIKRSTG